MSEIAEVHVGDIGTAFIGTILEDSVVVDISAAPSMKVIFRKPTGEVVENVGEHTTDGTDGKMQFVTTVSGDLDVSGLWSWQLWWDTITGDEWHTDTLSFRVYPNLN